ncbi:MAG: hypothetical protein WCT49_01165 [Candidatus Paceibacterota bacterium]|jgi:hypothetical protein|nr:hypothetical protein [Candidatus Paceibacterota bacterium]
MENKASGGSKNEDVFGGEFTVRDPSSIEDTDFVIDIPYSKNPEEKNFALKDAVEAKVKEYLEIERKLDFYEKELTEHGLDFLATLSDDQVQEMTKLASSPLAIQARSDRFDVESTRRMLEMTGGMSKEKVDATVQKTHFENLIKKAMDVVQKEQAEKDEQGSMHLEDQKKIADLRKALDLPESPQDEKK